LDRLKKNVAAAGARANGLKENWKRPGFEAQEKGRRPNRDGQTRRPLFSWKTVKFSSKKWRWEILPRYNPMP
jgi:hypothetical protein